MLPADIWDTVIKHVQCTKTLLRLRRVSKMFVIRIPRNMITGVPSNLERLLWDPITHHYDKIHITEHEDIEGSLVADGKQFWAWVYTDPIRLIQFDSEKNVGRVESFKMSSNVGSLLWIKMATNGLICILTTSDDESDDTPIFLFVLKRSPGLQTLEIVTTKEIDRDCLMRRSVLNHDYCFSRNNIQCFSWEKRTFIVMMPIHQEGYLSIMEIKDTKNKWTTWNIPCDPSTRIGCIRQVKHLIYIMPARGSSVCAINLLAADPYPVFLHTLPVIPSGAKWRTKNTVIQQNGVAAMMDVSEDGQNFIVHVKNMKRVYHMTKSSIRSLEQGSMDINSFGFIGNDAVVCFIKASAEYRLYNLLTNDRVRSFHFTFVPQFALLGNQCIWSVGHCMSVYRQIAKE